LPLLGIEQLLANGFPTLLGDALRRRPWRDVGFPGNTAVQRVASAIYEQGGVVSAVCHGPAALVDVKLSNGDYLVAGKRLAAFTNSEERAVGLHTTVPFLLADKLSSRGAHHQAAPDWTAKVVVDGRLVTGQNPQSAAGVGEAVRDLMLSPR